MRGRRQIAAAKKWLEVMKSASQMVIFDEEIRKVKSGLRLSERVSRDIRKWTPQNGDDLIEMYRMYKGCCFTNKIIEKQAKINFENADKYLERTIEIIAGSDSKTSIE